MQTFSLSCSSSSSSLGFRVRASSFDTQQRLSYNPNAPRKLKKDQNNDIAPPMPAVTVNIKTLQSVSALLKHQSQVVSDLDESYMGYERWLPNPAKVEKPRSVFNAASLAYIGDCIYELYARRHFLFPPLSIDEYNERVMAVVRCEAQDALLQKLVTDNYFSAEERNVLRWGKNIGSAKTRTKRRAGSAVYNRASSLETLVGYLYLTNATRLDEMMQKLGFSTGDSTQMVLEEANGSNLSARQMYINLPACTQYIIPRSGSANIKHHHDCFSLFNENKSTIFCLHPQGFSMTRFHHHPDEVTAFALQIHASHYVSQTNPNICISYIHTH